MWKKFLASRCSVTTASINQRHTCLWRGSLVLVGMATVSMLTPVFSEVGLLVLQLLPLPPANPQRTTADASATKTNILNTDNSSTTQNNTNPHNTYPSLEPTAYIVLGGGLTRHTTSHSQTTQTQTTQDSNNKELNKDSSDHTHKPIIVNQYTRSRLQAVWHRYQQHPLPIILSGVESPWMQEWLASKGILNVVSENASMNTCENARFTAKRLAIQHAFLVTDAYHMRRAQRQFALNGITTIAMIAPLPEQKSWLNWQANWRHSRRTIYELAAYARDIIKPQDNCRDANSVSDTVLKHSRKNSDLKLY